MNTITLIRNRAINSARRILTGSRTSLFFGSTPAKSDHTLSIANNSLKPRFNHDRANHHPFQIHRTKGIDVAQKVFGLPSSKFAPPSMHFSFKNQLIIYFHCLEFDLHNVILYKQSLCGHVTWS